MKHKTHIENNMIPKSDCPTKNIINIKSNPSSSPLSTHNVVLNHRQRSLANNSIRKQPHINPVKEVVSNFNTSHRYATASQILLNSEQVDCLIDSGAFKSFISEQYYKRRTFQIGKVTSNKRWVTANGNPIQVLGQTELNLQIGACNLNTTFIIAKNLAHDVLIGVDILKPNNFIINYEKNTLTCNSYSIPIQTVTPVKTNLIHSTSSINLSPNTTTTIWIKYDIPNVNLFVNPLGKAKGFPTVVTTCNDGPNKNHIPIFLTNSTPIYIRINRGDVIACISEANILCSINSETDFDSFILQEMTQLETVNSIQPSSIWKPSERIKTNNKLSKTFVTSTYR